MGKRNSRYCCDYEPSSMPGPHKPNKVLTRDDHERMACALAMFGAQPTAGVRATSLATSLEMWISTAIPGPHPRCMETHERCQSKDVTDIRLHI